MDLGLRNKVILVSGASKGLGYATAKACAAEGALVSLSSSNKISIDEAASAIQKETSAHVSPFTVDVRSEKDITTWIESTAHQFGRIDGIFINAGGPPAGEFMSFSDADWQGAFELLVLSSIRMSRAAIPHLTKEGGAMLFDVSSTVKEPIANLTLSNVLRASVSALSKTLSRELAQYSIRVNQILPGRIDTDRVKSLDATNAAKLNRSNEEIKKQNIAAIPLGRYGDPDEFGRVAAFLLSPASSYITGSTVTVDGGTMKSVL